MRAGEDGSATGGGCVVGGGGLDGGGGGFDVAVGFGARAASLIWAKTPENIKPPTIAAHDTRAATSRVNPLLPRDSATGQRSVEQSARASEGRQTDVPALTSSAELE